MKYYIIAGEASGDLHASNLIKNIKECDDHAEFRGFGGDLMMQNGTELAMHYKKMSFIGIMEVVKNLKTIKKSLAFCKKDLISYKPDVLILIDYPGFNLKMAEYARENGIRTVYYIAPKIWASRKGRIKRIRKSVDKLFVILPFEETYFKNLGVNAEYNGNPLSDALAAFKPKSLKVFKEENNLNEKPIVALLAGSRKMEIRLCLPEMIKVCAAFKDYQFVLAAAPAIKKEYYEQFIHENNVRIVYDNTYNLLTHARAAVVVSGTATLEAALFRIPQAVIYKVSTLTYLIGRPFVWIKFFSLVNIIMKREVVREFLQFRLAKKIKSELQRILYQTEYRDRIFRDYDDLKAKVGSPGTSKRAAQSIYKFLSQ